MFSYSAHLFFDVHCSWEQKKKKEFFIRPVNKIIKSLSHLSSLSVTLSVTLSFLSQSLSHLISQNSLRQTSLPPPHASRHWLPHAADCLISSHLISRHLTPHAPRVSSHLISRCRSPHAASRLISSHLISLRQSPHLISSHLTPLIACSSSRRSEAHRSRRSEIHGARQPILSADPARRYCACLWLVIFYFVCNCWFCLV